METTRLLLTGDVNCQDDGVLDTEPLRDLEALFAEADIRIGNLEGAFHDPAVGLDYKPGWRHIAPERLDLIRGRFDAVACANNVHHGQAIETSNRMLDEAGIKHTGAGRNIQEARTPAVVDHNGTRVGMLAYTAIFWPIGHAATDDAPGVAVVRNTTAYEPHPRLIEMPGASATVRSNPFPEDLAAIRADIAALRERVDIVVVYFHWGVTGNDEITEYQRILGHAAINAGADIVAGSHPHIPQGIEFHANGVILYSLGNFMFGWGLHQEMTKDGLVARIDARADEPWEVSVVPVRRVDGVVVPLVPESADGRRIAQRVADLSRQYGTTLEPAEDRYRVAGPAPQQFGSGVPARAALA